MSDLPQRLTEDYVYAEILHRAAMCKDNYEQVSSTLL